MRLLRNSNVSTHVSTTTSRGGSPLDEYRERNDGRIYVTSGMTGRPFDLLAGAFMKYARFEPGAPGLSRFFSFRLKFSLAVGCRALFHVQNVPRHDSHFFQHTTQRS